MTRSVVNPATGAEITTVPEAAEADVARAVASARHAFDTGPWRSATAQARGRVLFQMADLVRRHATALAQLETANCGKPIIEREMDMADTAACLEYFANDTPYGLDAAVWSRDIFRCLRVVKQLRAGIVWVNTMQPCYVESPWGGYKASGQGRELGLAGAEEFLETKQVHINLSEAPLAWY